MVEVNFAPVHGVGRILLVNGLFAVDGRFEVLLVGEPVGFAVDEDLVAAVPGLHENVVVVVFLPFAPRMAEVMEPERDAAVHHQIVVESAHGQFRGQDPNA